MAYDSRSSHPRNQGNRYERDSWTAPIVTPKREAIADQMLAMLDDEAPAKPGLKRLGAAHSGYGTFPVCEHNFAEWEATLLDHPCTDFSVPDKEEARRREEEEVEWEGLQESRWQREDIAAWELGLPEETRWSSEGYDRVVEGLLDIPDVEHEEEVDLNYEPWLPYMTQEEFMDHMDGGWYTGGWHVVSVR